LEEEKRRAEAARQAEEEKRRVEAARQAEEEKRRAEAARLAEEEQRAEAARLAEEEEERAVAARQAEGERQQADTARQTEGENRRARQIRWAPRIAIIYRREDSALTTSRIFNRLAAHYGAGSVFQDGDNIPLGVGFREYINTMLDQTDIALVVVGKRWLGPLPGRQPRINDPSDPVRVEVETALRNGMPVVPVLVEGGAMPNVDQLPDSLKEFVYRNGLDVDSGRDFDQHIERLIRNIEPILARRAEVPRLAEEEKRRTEVVRTIEEEQRWTKKGRINETLNSRIKDFSFINIDWHTITNIISAVVILYGLIFILNKIVR
jgi:hypothetical protein